MKAIVVGIDGSASSAHALRWAVDEARWHDAHVTALWCWGTRADEEDEELRARDEHRAQAELARFVADTVPDVDGLIDCQTMESRPEWGLLRAGEAADLVVVGARGVDGLRGLLAGSVSQQVVHHAHVPVAVVRDSTPDPVRRFVLVGVDGSEGAHRALVWAVEEARRRHAPLEVVHAWSFPAVGSPWGPTVDPGVSRFEAEAHQVLADQLAAVDTTDLTGPVRARVVQGGPGDVLVEFAYRAQLAVVGARGVGGLHELLLGSVSQHVSHHATCPTIVVRPSEEAP